MAALHWKVPQAAIPEQWEHDRQKCQVTLTVLENTVKLERLVEKRHVSVEMEDVPASEVANGQEIVDAVIAKRECRGSRHLLLSILQTHRWVQR